MISVNDGFPGVYTAGEDKIWIQELGQGAREDLGVRVRVRVMVGVKGSQSMGARGFMIKGVRFGGGVEGRGAGADLDTRSMPVSSFVIAM